MSNAPLDGLEPRIRRMLLVLLRNQKAICRPSRGVLELHFKGRHLEARLIGHEPLVMDGPEESQENGEPPPRKGQDERRAIS